MSAPTMASLPPLDSHSALRTPSDYGYQPVFSAPDLAIRQAVDSAQTQWTEQFNQLQTYTRLLEAQLQQMSDGQKALQNQMVQMIFQQQQQQWQPQPQRKQGRPHPGKSMRAKKRKQAQAVLEQANSSSSEAASDADCPTAAPAPAAAAAASTSTQQSPCGAAAAAAETAATAESKCPGSTPPKLEAPEAAPSHKAAVTLENAAAAAAVTSPRIAPSSPAGHAEQTDEGGWIDVGKQMPSSPTSGAPQSVPAAAMEDGNKSLVKAAVEEAMQMLLCIERQHPAVKKELIETRQVAAKEALAATLAEGLQQHSQRTHCDIAAAVEVMKQQHAEEAVGAQQAFKEQLATFKEEMLQQLHAEQRRGLEALKEEQQKEAAAARTAVTGSLARLDTLQNEQQSNFEQLRRDYQELGVAHKAANETLAATLAQRLEAVKLQQAEELSSAKVAFSDSITALKVEMLEQIRSAEAVNKQHADETVAMKQALEVGLAELRQETSRLGAEQKQSLQAMMDAQRSEAQKIRALFSEKLATVRTELKQEFQEVRQACTNLQATSSKSFRSIGDDIAAMQPQIAELMAKVTELSQQPPRAQEAEAALATAARDADQLGTQDLPPPPGLSVAPAASQTPASVQTIVPTEEAEAAAVTAAASASASLTTLAPRTTPQRCRVVACYWNKAGWTGNVWKLDTEKELAEPFLVTATTLSNVKVEAAKALERHNVITLGYYQQLKDFDGSRSFVPSQEAEERKTLQALGCGEASLVKVHFREEWRGVSWHNWWSYEVVA